MERNDERIIVKHETLKKIDYFYPEKMSIQRKRTK
jgi:hypothetical protein